MDRILVTGGAGFIGSHFTRRLLRASNAQVMTLDKLTYAGNLRNLADLKGNPRHHFLRGDICNAKTMKRLASKADCIVNFAAETHVDRSIKSPSRFFRPNILGVLTILEACRETKTRFLQIGTDEVYGEVASGASRESDQLRPSNPYAATKASADVLIGAYARTYGLEALISRSTNNYGPFQHPEKFVPVCITHALEERPIPIYGAGQARRDWLFVEDNCEAIDLLMRKGEPNEVYNVSTQAEASNIDVARKILKVMGKSDRLLKHVADRPGHDLRYALDSSKLGALGWSPKVGLDEGLRLTADWYMTNRRWWRLS